MLRSNKVAIKLTNVGAQYREEAVSQLQQEMTIYSKISNFQHIIKVYDLHFVQWEGRGLLVLSMEYDNGGTFRQWLLDHKNDLKTRQTTGLDYFKQACHGARDAHQVGVVHFDLKPENFLFSDGVIKVSDFGAAIYGKCLLNSGDWHIDTCLSGVLGTPPYMSPEIYDGAEVDINERADIYSLGIILYELLSLKGRPPFEGPFRLVEKLHLNARVPQLPEAGEKLAVVISRCLEKNPAQRYQSVEELLDDMEGRTDSISLEASTEKPESKAEETWEKASVYFSEGDFNEASVVLQ
jgi:serine/threonine protein kinase